MTKETKNQSMLPRSVRVAAFDFEVRPWTMVEGVEAQRFGECSTYRQEIRVDTSLKPQKLLDTFLHEINHAIYWAYHLEDTDKEERTIGTMATAWAQIYRDNPRLLRFINLVCAEKAAA